MSDTPDPFQMLTTRCDELAAELRATREAQIRLEAAAAAQADATSRMMAADTQHVAEYAEVRATTAAMVAQITGPPSFDTRFAELHALVRPATTTTMSGPGFNVNLPDPETVSKYGKAFREWSVKGLLAVLALVLILKINACDGERMMDRIDGKMARDSTARTEELRDVQAEAEADRDRNTDRILEAVGDSAATAPTDR